MAYPNASHEPLPACHGVNYDPNDNTCRGCQWQQSCQVNFVNRVGARPGGYRSPWVPTGVPPAPAQYPSSPPSTGYTHPYAAMMGAHPKRERGDESLLFMTTYNVLVECACSALDETHRMLRSRCLAIPKF